MKQTNGKDLDVLTNEHLYTQTPPNQAEFELRSFRHWLIIKPWRRHITYATLIGVCVTFVTCKFVLDRWYQASAIIRPASQQGWVSPLAMMLSSSFSFSQTLSSVIGNSTGLSSQTPSDAAEYMDIVQSYDFSVNLIERHHLVPILEKPLKARIRRRLKPLLARIWPNSVGPQADLWHWYQDLQDRFSIDYDDKQGNLTLTFLDLDRTTAREILVFYIDDLRDKIRQRTIQETQAAVQSLQEQYRATSDALLQQQLATTIAGEIQQESAAEAEADFAFSLTEPPFTSIKVYEPKAVLFCLLAALLIPIGAVAWLEFYANVYAPFRKADILFEQQFAKRLNGETLIGDRMSRHDLGAARL